MSETPSSYLDREVAAGKAAAKRGSKRERVSLPVVGPQTKTRARRRTKAEMQEVVADTKVAPVSRWKLTEVDAGGYTIGERTGKLFQACSACGRMHPISRLTTGVGCGCRNEMVFTWLDKRGVPNG